MNAKNDLREHLKTCERLLIGIGEEWKRPEAEVIPAYDSLYRLTEGKDFFIVTTVTDGRIFKSGIDPARIVAPCGNDRWQQCRDACTKDIWEPGEVPDGVCPHCGAPLIPNTVAAEHYIEEGYLPQWQVYTRWLAGTLNKELLILELGVGFGTPTVIRWPFEKTAFFNQKSHMYRINERFSQISQEISGRAVPVSDNSVEFVRGL